MIERLAKYAGWLTAIGMAGLFLWEQNPLVLKSELQAIDARLTFVQRTVLRIERDKWEDRIDAARVSPDTALAREMIDEAEAAIERIEAELATARTVK